MGLNTCDTRQNLKLLTISFIVVLTSHQTNSTALDLKHGGFRSHETNRIPPRKKVESFPNNANMFNMLKNAHHKDHHVERKHEFFPQEEHDTQHLPFDERRHIPDSEKARIAGIIEEDIRHNELFLGNILVNEEPPPPSIILGGPPVNPSKYCPSYCTDDYTWFPEKNCQKSEDFCCYHPHKKLHCCKNSKDFIDTSDLGENYLCPSKAVRWWNHWWPVILGIILTISMVALIVSAVCCVLQVTKDRRRPIIRRPQRSHSTHSFHSDCSECRGGMQMDNIDENVSHDNAIEPENGLESEENRGTGACGGLNTRRTIFIIGSENDQQYQNMKVVEPPPYEEIEPPPAYEP